MIKTFIDSSDFYLKSYLQLLDLFNLYSFQTLKHWVKRSEHINPGMSEQWNMHSCSWLLYYLFIFSGYLPCLTYHGQPQLQPACPEGCFLVLELSFTCSHTCIHGTRFQTKTFEFLAILFNKVIWLSLPLSFQKGWLVHALSWMKATIAS